MEIQADSTTLDAILKARRIARNAELIEVAKGRQPWWLWVFPSILLLALGYFLRSGRIGMDVGLCIFSAFVVAGWLDKQTDKRLDAVVQLLLDEREHGHA
jgi:hypothetical protein